MEVSEGQVLAGKYRVERVLGRGGMGVVVAATHLQLGERVALKFLLPEAMGNPDAIVRFDREARAAVRIKSEYVVRVSDVGRLDTGSPYMVMEYLEGIDLSAWLAQRGALPIQQAVEFVLQACEAIAEAHALGIVHRDLKPANLFAIERPDGTLAVKVLDFGISKASNAATHDARITGTLVTMGSPLYMSPEQMESARDVDLRGDIWAIGVVLYELISGRAPFAAASLAELAMKIVMGQPIPLRNVCLHAPPALEAVVRKCLQKDPSARYQSVAELAVALIEFGPKRSRASVERIARLTQRVGVSATITQMPVSSERSGAAFLDVPKQTMASWGQTEPPRSKPHRRAGWVVGGLLGMGVVALAAATWRATAEKRGAGPGASAVERPLPSGATASGSRMRTSASGGPLSLPGEQKAERATEPPPSSLSATTRPLSPAPSPSRSPVLFSAKAHATRPPSPQPMRVTNGRKEEAPPAPSVANNPLKMSIQ